ncbi:MAG: ComEC/Rec2 family competence protein [Patescibacteria group bacterium]
MFFLPQLWMLELSIVFIVASAIAMQLHWRLVWRVWGFIVLGCLCGVLIYAGTFPGENSVTSAIGRESHVEGVVIDVGASEKSGHLTLSHLQIDGEETQDKLLAFAPLYPEFAYGDRISFRCTPTAPEPIEEFAYDRYLANKNIFATCFVYSSPLVLERGAGNPVLEILYKMKSQLLSRIQQIFGEPQGSLMAGLLIGETNFSDAWNLRFQQTGTSHIVAASGYNVALVTFIVLGFLVWAGLKRQQAFFLVSVAIVVYAILCGAEAAIVRASVMGFLVLLSQQIGRRSTMKNVLLLTPTILLLMHPRALRDDIGFELSMAATLGLIYFVPYIQSKLSFVPKTLSLQTSLAATLAATVACLPVLLFRFGTLSIVAPIVNLLILPWLPYIMGLGALVLVVSIASLPLAIFVSGPATALLSSVLFVIRSISEVPFGSFSIPDWLAYLLTSAVACAVWLIVKRKKLFSHL